MPATAAVAALLAVAACALGIAAREASARAAGRAAPRLGAAYSRGQSGFGGFRPKTIFLGGDPTGLLEHIRWSAWGGDEAVGHGDAEYDWPGTAVAANGFSSGARVVAFHLGSCRGRRSYNALEWYFPKYGQSFDPHRYIDACTGAFVGNPRTMSCPDVQIRDGSGVATFVIVSGIACSTASRLIGETPVAHYLPQGGRFLQDGFRCGSEGAANGAPVFACERGPREFSYTVQP